MGRGGGYVIELSSQEMNRHLSCNEDTEPRVKKLINWWHQSKQQGSPISFTASLVLVPLCDPTRNHTVLLHRAGAFQDFLEPREIRN